MGDPYVDTLRPGVTLKRRSALWIELWPSVPAFYVATETETVH